MQSIIEVEPANVPTLNVVCRGTPREMGLAQGQVLQAKIHQLRDRLADLEAFRLRQPRWLPFRLYRRWAERKAGQLVAAAWADSRDLALAERLAGLAEGADLEGNALALFNVLEPMLASVDAELALAAGAACSVVAVRNSRSADGQPILARNFDYLPLVQPFYVLREDQPQGGLRSLVFTTAPLIGAVDGINECGLCITYNYAFAIDSPRPAPTISMRIAEALSRCQTVAEAVDWIANRPHWGAGLLMLADQTGDLAALELSHTRCQVRRPAPGEDLLFHTNSYQTPAMQSVQVPPAAIWSQHVPNALRGRQVLQSADSRDTRLDELLSKQRRFDLDDLTRLMADHGPEGVPSADTLCIHSDYWHTTASLQLLPASRKIRVSYSTTCRPQYHEFQL